MFGISPGAIDMEQPDRELLERFEKQSIPVMDMLPVFKEKAQKGVYLYGLIDNHMNARGQAVVAEAIYPWIEKNLPPKVSGGSPIQNQNMLQPKLTNA